MKLHKACKICGKEIETRIFTGSRVIYRSKNRACCFVCKPYEGPHKNFTSTAENGVWQRNARSFRKEKLVTIFGSKCTRCGYDKCLSALEFHHNDRKTKNSAISAMGYCCAWEKLVAEAKKCTLLCGNCHREIEHLEKIGSKETLVKIVPTPDMYETQKELILVTKEELLENLKLHGMCKTAKSVSVPLNKLKEFCEANNIPILPKTTPLKFIISKEELEDLVLVQKKSYDSIGKQFGVSGNTIKDRCRKLGIVLEIRHNYPSR